MRFVVVSRGEAGESWGIEAGGGERFDVGLNLRAETRLSGYAVRWFLRRERIKWA